jgi:hypothetical protein
MDYTGLYPGVRALTYHPREAVYQALFVRGTAVTSQSQSGNNGEAAVSGCIV